jgi:hypothetical protein
VKRTGQKVDFAIQGKLVVIEESPAVIEQQPVPVPAFRLGASLRDNEGNPPSPNPNSFLCAPLS